MDNSSSGKSHAITKDNDNNDRKKYKPPITPPILYFPKNLKRNIDQLMKEFYHKARLTAKNIKKHFKKENNSIDNMGKLLLE